VNGKTVQHSPGPHVLSHTYITIAFGAGVPEYEIGMLVKHRLPKETITQQYAGERVALIEGPRKSQERITATITARLSSV
jgi:hypothetical protein